MKRSLPLLAILLVVGCGHDQTAQPSALPPTSTSQAPASTSAPAPAPTPAPASSAAPAPGPTAAPAPTPVAEPAPPQPCSDDDLAVGSGQPEEAGTMRRVNVSFTNTSADMCTMVSYPTADLVTAAGGVLVHVARRPANAAPRLELQPGEVATADVTASAVDTATGDACGRIGTLVVTAPDTVQAHTLAVNLPICDASISAVG